MFELSSENVTYALGLIALVSIAFNIWAKVRNPQISDEKKAALLAQQVQLQLEANERRFAEMQNSIKESFALAQNHIHTVDQKVDALGSSVMKMSNEVIKLSTIIEERIPKK